jgi:N-dimethylarginine dimethylaminohydrolase
MAQLDGLVKTLEARGIVVHRPATLSPEEMAQFQDIQKGAMFLYARDPMLVIGNTIIETALQAPMRFRERYALRPLLEAKAKLPGVLFFAMPSPSPKFDQTNAYLEGGDVLLNGYDIYVGHSGHGSNQAGREWLQRVLGSKYRVQGVDISPEFEHLDCVMSLVRPGLGLLCKEAVKSELPPSIRDWEFIEVSMEEAKRLGCNALVLDKDTIILDAQHPRIAEELRRRKVTVIELPYDAVARWNGGFRCSHHPLRRVSILE